MNNVEIGKEYKLRELCELMDIEYKRGGQQHRNILSKISHIYNIEKVNNKSLYRIISETEQIIKEPHFKIDDNLKHGEGVYIIQLNNTVYIGQTNDFYRRYYKHKTGQSL